MLLQLSLLAQLSSLQVRSPIQNFQNDYGSRTQATQRIQSSIPRATFLILLEINRATMASVDKHINKMQTAMISALWFAFRYSGGKEEVADIFRKKIGRKSYDFSYSLQRDSTSQIRSNLLAVTIAGRCVVWIHHEART